MSTSPAPQSTDSGEAGSTGGAAEGAGAATPSSGGKVATDNLPFSAASLNSMEVLDDKIALEPADRISFRVVEDQNDAVSRIVTDTGEVDFPYVGRLKVSGLTCRQVAVQLKKLLEVDYYKRATVIVGLDTIASHATEVPQDLVWIVGQVRTVGPFQISKIQPTTVSQVILRAGGFGDFADERKVRLVHRPPAADNSGSPDSETALNNLSQSEVVDVKAIFQGRPNKDPVVRPNDLIIVPKRLVNF